AALTQNNIARNCRLPSKNLNSQPFTCRVSAVPYAAFSFFMCHFSLLLMLLKKFILRNLVYPYFCKALAMTVFLLVTFTAVFLKYYNFVALKVVYNFSLYFLRTAIT